MADEHKEAHGEEHGGGGHGHGGGGHGHGGGGGHEEGHEGAPEWLISFADNVALMMGFFVILLAMNMKEPTSGGVGGKEQNGGQPNSKMVDAAIAIREAFNSPVNLNSMDPIDQPLIRRLKDTKKRGEANDRAPQGDQDTVQATRPGDYFSPGGSVSFEEGSSELSAEAVAALMKIAEHARGKKFIIEVRGHASASESYPSTKRGYQLSYERAAAVADQLVEQGLKWDNIRLIAEGSMNRVVPSEYTGDAFRANQMVEVILTQDTRASDNFSHDPATAPKPLE